MADNLRLAVLIDADNASAAKAQDLLAEIANHGLPSVKRAYGDWTTQNLVGWKEQLLRSAIQPIQQFAYTKGKNSTDSALIIDAMDLLYGGNVDGFCLVSSDSDYTRLATRLRESGKLVLGMGAAHTPEPFRAACDRFIFFEVMGKLPAQADALAEASLPDLQPLLTAAIKVLEREDGWAMLAAVGSQIIKTHTSFDPRSYGAKKLGELVKKQPYLECRTLQDAGGGETQLQVRIAPGRGTDA